MLLLRLFGKAIAIMFAFGALGSFLTKPPSTTSGVVCAVFALVFWRMSRRRRADSWRADPATERQKEFADELGINYPRGISKGELSALIDKAKRR